MSTINQNVREVKRQMEDVGETLSDAASETMAQARTEISKLRAKLRDNTAHLQEELGVAGKRFVDGAKTFQDAMSDQVRAHPLAAFGIAFAIGAIATRLIRSR